MYTTYITPLIFLYLLTYSKSINNFRKERISNSSNNETLYDEQPGTSKQLDNQNSKTTVFPQQNKTKANSGKTPKWFKPV